MGLRSWSAGTDRRSQDTWRRPEVAPVAFVLALALALHGLLIAASATSSLVFGAVWTVLGVVSLVARRRDRR